jgi:ABC-type glycerol-3-phosphate transport system substrate-binding protein
MFSLRTILLGVGIFATVLSVLIFSGKISVGDKTQKVVGDVAVWGTLPEAPMNAITQSFNPAAKTYAVRYRYIPEDIFSQKLLEALASGTGPDVILAPYQTILSQADRIYPFQMDEKGFRDLYVDGASILYTPQGVLALPVSIEPMVLFYNRTLFSKHGIINPPMYWDELTTLAPILTIKEGGKFIESAVALGTPGVPYSKDIIMAIISQLGQTPVVRLADRDGTAQFTVLVNRPVTEGSEILPLATADRFFTQFGDPGQNAYTWNQDQENVAADTFVAEKLAMYVGYSGEYQTLRNRNPRGDFQMTTLPQTRGYNTFSTGMRMYALATLKTTKNPLASLTVESQFAGMGVSPSIAAIVGGVPALRSYAGTQSLDPVVARSMLVAKGWYDSYQKETNAYASSMISDIINYRKGVNDAASAFSSRLVDLYNKN